jgi:hypothetical protein
MQNQYNIIENKYDQIIFFYQFVCRIKYDYLFRSSSTDLLEQFLSEKGWDLLNAW